MFFINSTRFASFPQAAICAIKQTQQRGECLIRNDCGTLIADFRLKPDGTISVCATDVGRCHVEAWAD